MNSEDKKRLLYLCSNCPKDGLVIFDDKLAFIQTNSHTISFNLSESISPAKIGVNPLTLQSIISTMPDEEIKIEHVKEFTYKFKCKKITRTISAMDADYVYQVNVRDALVTQNILDSDSFAKCLIFVVNFANKDKLSLTGNVFAKFYDNKVDFFATNGASMAFKRYSQKLPFEENLNILISQDHIPPIVRTLSDTDAKIAIVNVDATNRVQFSTKSCSTTIQRITEEFRNFDEMMNRAAALTTNKETKPDTQFVEFNCEEVRSALSTINSMFVKNEFPYVDVIIDFDKITLGAESTNRGYDCVKAVVTAKSTTKYEIRVSSLLFLRSLPKSKNSVKMYWRSESKEPVNPFVVDSGSEIVFFAPLSIPPKSEDNYD